MISRLVRESIGFLRRQKRPFKVNIFRNLIQNFSLSLTQQYQSIYMAGLGANPFQLGYVNSLSGVASTILSIPTGWFADNFGIKIVLLITIPLMALGSAIFGLAGNWGIASIALIIYTLSFSIGFTVCPTICGSTLSNEERATGMQLCDTVSAAPRMVAPIIAAYLITLFGGMNVKGIRPLFWIQFLGLMVAASVIYVFFSNPRAVERGSGSLKILRDLRSVLDKGTMVKRWIVNSMVSSFPWYAAFYVPLYAAEMKNADQYVVGGMGTASTLLITLLAIPMGRLADVYGRKRMILLMTPLTCASYLLLVHARNDTLLIVSGLLSGFSMLTGVTQGAISAELVPQEHLGSWFGVLGLFRGLVNVASPLICGFIWEAVGPASVFYFLILTQAASMLLLYSIPTEITR